MTALDLETAAKLQGGTSVALYDGSEAWRAASTIIDDVGTTNVRALIDTPRSVCAELRDVRLVHGRSPVIDGVPIFLGMSHNGDSEQAKHAPNGQITAALDLELKGEGPTFKGAHFLIAGHHDNWWHFTYNYVLRLRALELAWPEVCETIPLAVHADVPQALLPIFRLLGHPNPLIFFDRTSLPRFEHLLVAETPVHMRPERIAAAKDAAAPLARLRRPGGNRRIYLSRRDARWRRVTNEDELVTYLTSRGFEIHQLAGKPLDDIAVYMSQADIVVGPSGANLAATMFCSPGTRVVELSPPAMTRKNWFSLPSAMLGLLHWKIEGPAVEDPTRGAHAYDFRAPAERVRTLVDELLS